MSDSCRGCLGPQGAHPAEWEGPALQEAIDDESLFPPPVTHAVTFLQRSSAAEATEALVRLLEALDSRQEALVQRLEQRVHQTLSEHLEKVTEAVGVRLANSGKLSVAASNNSELAREPIASLGNTGLVQIPPEHVEDSFARKASIAPQVLIDEDAINPESPKIPVGDAQQAPQDPTPRTSLFSNRSMTSQIFDPIEYWQIEVVEAQGLTASDVNLSCCSGVPSSDPYAKIIVGSQESKREVFRTETSKKTLNPVWNAFYKFKVDPDEIWDGEEVVIELWDEDMLDKDDLLGRVSVNRSDVQAAGGSLSRWFDISPEADCQNATGKVLLKATLQLGLQETTAFFSLLGAEADVADEVMHDSEDQLQATSNKYLAMLQTMVSRPMFDAVFCGIIVLNAIAMMVELEYYGRKLREHLELDEPGSTHVPELESALKGLNFIFACIFMVELALRLAAFGYKFLLRLANWVDILVVMTSVLEVLGTETFINLTFLRLVRLSKLARLLRIVLLAAFCNPLRILMKAIYTGFGSLFWSFVLLFMIEIIAALFMTQILADSISDKSLDRDMRLFIYTYYGTTSRTTLTMFQITMAPGAWGLLGRPIIENVSPAFAWFFMLYVGGVSFAIIRIITALFLRQTLQVAASDDQLMRNEKIKAQRKYSENVRELFNHADASGTGEVTFDQFQKLLMDEHVRAWLQILEINPKNASYIFELVDDGDGRLTLDEFLGGVFRLKGTAQQIDMVLLQRETKEIKNIICKLWELKELKQSKRDPSSPF